MSHKILVVVDDFFFRAKISETAKHTGAAIQFVKNVDEIKSIAHSERPSLIIFDLNSTRFQPVQTIASLKADESLRDIPIVGYLSHVQVELQQQAAQAGCDQVMPRSKFTQILPQLLSNASQT